LASRPGEGDVNIFSKTARRPKVEVLRQTRGMPLLTSVSKRWIRDPRMADMMNPVCCF
jgi:hypothetical protein